MTDGAARWTHEPPAYDCPFCLIQRGTYNEHNQAGDVVAVAKVPDVDPWWLGGVGGAQLHRAARAWPDQAGDDGEDGAARADVGGHIEGTGDEQVQIGGAVGSGEG